MRIRINDIECRFRQGRYEIVKWQRNLYYGKLQEYIDSGYNLVDGFVSNTNHHIQASIFDSPETCYTIAAFRNTLYANSLLIKNEKI
jgi:hypothetical protein